MSRRLHAVLYFHVLTSISCSSAAAKYGDTQIAIFNVPKRGYFATQQVSPCTYVVTFGFLTPEIDVSSSSSFRLGSWDSRRCGSILQKPSLYAYTATNRTQTAIYTYPVCSLILFDFFDLADTNHRPTSQAQLPVGGRRVQQRS